MTTSLFQCNNKEEEKRIINYFTFDILFEISKFIKKIKDFLHFAQTNKSFYENLILNDNNRMIALNEIFKHNKIILNNKINYPEYLFQVKNLMLLDESELDPNLEIIKKFNNLKRLRIGTRFMSINEDNFSEKTFSNLQELYITSGNLNESYLKLKNLKILHIAINFNIEDKHLKELTNLTELSISYCRNINGDCLQYLTNLTELNIKSCRNITGDCLQYLKGLKKLTISGSDHVTDRQLTDLKQLTDLTLTTCNNITGECLQYLNNLTSLNISCADKYLKEQKKLKKLIVDYCYNFTGECLQYLPKLEELTVNVKNIKPEYVNNLKNCNKLYLEGSGGNLKEESLQQLINLVSLDINYCSDYKCDFLPYLTNLTELHAMEIPNLKDEHLLNLKKLKKLYIFECKNIVGNCLLELTNLKDLTIINTKVTDEYLKNLKLLKRIEFSVDNDYLNSGKFLFNNENLKYFGFNVGLHSYSAGLKHVKEFRKLLNEGLDFKEASQKMIKLILED